MRVRANFPKGGFGFYGTRRRHGDVFDIEDGAKIGSWLIPVADEAVADEEPEKAPPKARARKKKATEDGGE